MNVDAVIADGRVPAVVIGDLTLVRPLALAGIPVLAIVSDPDDIVLSSRHVIGHLVVPGLRGGAEHESLERLTQLGETLAAAGLAKAPLFYGSDESLDFVRRHRAELGEHYAFLINPDPLAAALLDKERFAQLAAERGIHVPVSLSCPESIEHGIAGLRPPLLVKPKRKMGWKPLQRSLFDGEGKARVFSDAEALRADESFQQHKAELIVQECIPAQCVLSYHAFVDARGEELGSFAGRKIRAYPLVMGESACIELVHHGALEAFGRDVVRRLALVGPCKLDVVVDPRDGRCVLLEVNARYNLWHYLGAVHGVNLMQIAYEHLTRGTRVHAHRYRPRARWCNLYRDFRAFRALQREQAMTLPRWLGELVFEPRIYEAFAWNDPLPATRWFVRQVHQKVKRWHATG